jgi:hypothetical protein
LRCEGERIGGDESYEGDARRDLGHWRDETPVNRDGKRYGEAMWGWNWMTATCGCINMGFSQRE